MVAESIEWSSWILRGDGVIIVHRTRTIAFPIAKAELAAPARVLVCQALD